MSRKQSREIVFKLLFSLCFDTGGHDYINKDFLTLPHDTARDKDSLIEPHPTARLETMMEMAADEKPDGKELQYINKLCAAVQANLSEIDALIEKNAHGFSLDRIFKIDLTVLRMAVGEILFLSDTPRVVAVNEAVNIAKKYGTEKSAAYINGILASVLKGMEAK